MPPPANEPTPASIGALLSDVRARTPLVHSITNLVVTNSTANALLALGASPAMVEGVEEVAEFAAIAGALVINLGTMDAGRAQAMRLAADAARAAGTPWILDPVAVGVLSYRSQVAVELLAFSPAVVRGNASEIIALARQAGAVQGGAASGGRGVDSTAPAEAALDAAKALAAALRCVVVVSGATDYVTDGLRTIGVNNGHPMMSRVTGLGCTATALIGACLAVTPDTLTACVAGMVFTGLAGEMAAELAPGPGSLQGGLIDALYLMDADLVTRRAHLVAPDV
ncbi:hydroxyethylthiazole kinase [Lichenicoccus sp.]|uniref:hydroxyethylthiazole kinase n=1 Tax=Lichenicoccus sp. TaxID=2781899 RepID=UPI003D124F28